MTDKKTEALKLALEALERAAELLTRVGLHFNGINKAIIVIHEALALVNKVDQEESSGTEQPDMNLNCKSVQARLATSWGYVKAEQPAIKQDLTPEQPAHILPNGLTEAETNATASVIGLVAQQVLKHAPCQGMNCGITRTDQEHSPECQAEHAATIAGGKFVKPAPVAEPRKPQQEPVAFDVVCNDCGGNGLDKKDQNYFCAVCDGLGYVEKLLYTSPPASKPLTDEEIWKFWWSRPEVPEGEDDSMEAEFVAAVRAVLAAHNIERDA